MNRVERSEISSKIDRESGSSMPSMDRTMSSLETPFSSMSSLNSYGQIGGQIQSPYLQFDPLLVDPNANKSEFIFPDGGQRANRGRFELAFSQIGGSVMTGAGIGGAVGVVRGESITMNVFITHLTRQWCIWRRESGLRAQGVNSYPTIAIT